MIRVLGIDSGFANFGWAKIEVGADAERLIDAGLIRTAKASKKSVLASDDNVRRGQDIARTLLEVTADWQPAMICIESQSWPRNASATAKCGIGFGLAIFLSAVLRCGWAEATPKKIKKILTGNDGATKNDVLDALELRPGFGNVREILASHKIPRGGWEHPVDAAGAVVACLNTDLMLALRRQL